MASERANERVCWTRANECYYDNNITVELAERQQQQQQQQMTGFFLLVFFSGCRIVSRKPSATEIDENKSELRLSLNEKATRTQFVVLPHL